MSITNYDRDRAKKAYKSAFLDYIRDRNSPLYNWRFWYHGEGEEKLYDGKATQDEWLENLHKHYPRPRGYCLAHMCRRRFLKKFSNMGNRRKTRHLIRAEDWDSIPNSHTRVEEGNPWDWD